MYIHFEGEGNKDLIGGWGNSIQFLFPSLVMRSVDDEWKGKEE
jgi:hypothetical protein